jgi:hypothetical protein
MNLFFFFLDKTTNGGSENNLVYSNARELIVKNRKKSITQAKGFMKRKINTIRGSAQSGHHSFANKTLPVAKDFAKEFVTISGVIVAKAS